MIEEVIQYHSDNTATVKFTDLTVSRVSTDDIILLSDTKGGLTNHAVILREVK